MRVWYVCGCYSYMYVLYLCMTCMYVRMLRYVWYESMRVCYVCMYVLTNGMYVCTYVSDQCVYV